MKSKKNLNNYKKQTNKIESQRLSLQILFFPLFQLFQWYRHLYHSYHSYTILKPPVQWGERGRYLATWVVLMIRGAPPSSYSMLLMLLNQKKHRIKNKSLLIKEKTKKFFQSLIPRKQWILPRWLALPTRTTSKKTRIVFWTSEYSNV